MDQQTPGQVTDQSQAASPPSLPPLPTPAGQLEVPAGLPPLPAQDTPAAAPQPAPAPEPITVPGPAVETPAITIPESTQIPAPVAQDVRQQVVEHIQNGKSILVTVASNPSVDELSSAIALTLLLGRLDKHVTTVFSGAIPPAIEFLDPEATFENSVDSLRDFIIALSKDKADKLRYKVEDDVVRIFITPYRTVLSQKDLEFSQGDFNIDVIVALGVQKNEDLDKAITAHGKILHDATVVTINAGNKKSNLGAIDWNDSEASSVAEMLVSLSEVLGTDLLDEQTSTALLTGIVAETNRFSNEKTTPKVMTISAQLMAAGANQQLVATNLRQEGMISESVRKNPGKPEQSQDDGEMVLEHGKSGQKQGQQNNQKPGKGQNNNQNNNNQGGKKPKQPDANAKPAAPVAPLPEPTSAVPATEEPVANVDTAAPVVAEAALPAEDVPPLPAITPEPHHEMLGKPDFGGTLNATTTAAEEDNIAQANHEDGVNAMALDHGMPGAGEQDGAQDAIEAARQLVEDAEAAKPPVIAPPVVTPEAPLPTIETTAEADSSVSQKQASNEPISLGPPLTFDTPESSDSTDANVPAADTAEEPDPMGAFMQTHPADSAQPSNLSAPTLATPPGPNDLPPMPPLPGDPNGLPPMPPLPGQASDAPGPVLQPQVNPEFMQNMPQSQNSWTQAGDDLAAKQAEKDAQRQEKMDKMTQQYDSAVEQNQRIKEQQAGNNPNGPLPPLPPFPGANQ